MNATECKFLFIGKRYVRFIIIVFFLNFIFVVTADDQSRNSAVVWLWDFVLFVFLSNARKNNGVLEFGLYR